MAKLTFDKKTTENLQVEDQLSGVFLSKLKSFLMVSFDISKTQ